MKNGILAIDSPERSITINGSIFNAKKLKQELTIKMLKKELKYLSIDTSNGNILADNLEVQKGTIDTSNGHITVEGENKSDEFEKNTDAKNVLSIDTSNGNISVN